MSKWDSNELKPAWVDPPDPPRVGHARKDRRRWCRGRMGRHHVINEPEISALGRSYLARTGATVACYRAEWYAQFWLCQHQVRCTACGKILRHGLGDKCPDYSTAVTRWRRSPT
jgi:hypothetical protein